MEIRDIYIFIYMYSFFYGTFTCASMNYLDSAMQALFTRALRTSSGVAPTTAADSSIAHNTPRKIRGKTLNRRQEREREAKQKESKIQKGQGCKNNLKL